MRICQKCGADVDPDANYCDNCGIPFDEYPPVQAGVGEGEQSGGVKLDRKARNILIIAFVAFDLVIAVVVLAFVLQQ